MLFWNFNSVCFWLDYACQKALPTANCEASQQSTWQSRWKHCYWMTSLFLLMHALCLQNIPGCICQLCLFFSCISNRDCDTQEQGLQGLALSWKSLHHSLLKVLKSVCAIRFGSILDGQLQIGLASACSIAPLHLFSDIHFWPCYQWSVAAGSMPLIVLIVHPSMRAPTMPICVLATR